MFQLTSRAHPHTYKCTQIQTHTYKCTRARARTHTHTRRRCYLIFQLKTHTELFDDSDEGAGSEGGDEDDSDGAGSSEEGEEGPVLPVWAAAGLLAADTVLVAVIAEFLVDSITDVTPPLLLYNLTGLVDRHNCIDRAAKPSPIVEAITTL